MDARADLTIKPGDWRASPERANNPHSAWCVRDKHGHKVVGYLSLKDARAVVLGREALETLDEVRGALAESPELLEMVEGLLKRFHAPVPPICVYCGEALEEGETRGVEGDIHASCQDAYDSQLLAKQESF